MRLLGFPPNMSDFVNKVANKIDVWLNDVTAWISSYSNSPVVSVKLAGAQSVPSSVYTKVNLASVVIDTASLLDTVNHRIVIKKSGYYNLSGVVTHSGSAVLYIYQAGLLINGIEEAVFVCVNNGNASEYSATVAATCYLKAGDYVELFFYQTSGGGLSLSTGRERTHLTASLIREK